MKHYYVVTSKKIIETVTYKCWSCGMINAAKKTKSPQRFNCKCCNEVNVLTSETNDISKLGKEVE